MARPRLGASRLRLKFPPSRSVSALALLRLANIDDGIVGDESFGHERDPHAASGMDPEQPAELPQDSTWSSIWMTTSPFGASSSMMQRSTSPRGTH